MDLAFTDKIFNQFQVLVYEKCGINLHEGKKELVRARLSKRLRKIGFKSFNQYYSYLIEQDDGEEMVQMLDAISTNLTSFFREVKHFDFLEQNIMPQLKSELVSSHEKIRIWSAGCSSGEEPYSLAICFLEYFGLDFVKRLEIMATDISTRVLSAAQGGMYEQKRVENIPLGVLHKYFQRGHGKWDGYVRLKPFVRNLIQFKRFNLMEPFGSVGAFQVIFCRNVMIYFDKNVQETLVNKFFQCLKPGGHLFIGHSESLMRIRHEFKYIQPTIYAKA